MTISDKNYEKYTKVIILHDAKKKRKVKEDKQLRRVFHTGLIRLKNTNNECF